MSGTGAMVALDSLVTNNGVTAYQVMTPAQQPKKDITAVTMNDRKGLILLDAANAVAPTNTLGDLVGKTVTTNVDLSKDGVSTTDVYTIVFK